MVQKEIKFFFLTLAYFLLFSTYSLPIAFFPLLAQEKGLSNIMIGVIFSFLPFGGFIASLVFGKYMTVVGKRILFVLLNFFITASVFGFGSLNHVTTYTAFLGLAIAFRILQGIAVGGLASIIYGYIPTFYPETVQQRMLVMEFFLGLSITVSVNIGQLLYNAGGYSVPFYVIGSITFCVLFLIAFFLPQEVKTAKKATKASETHNNNQIGYKRFLSSFKFMILFLGIVGNVSAKTFVSTNLALHLETFPGGPDFLGMAFLLLSASFAIANLFFLKTLTFIDRRIFMIFGLVVEALSLFLIGPETLIGLPKTLPVLGVGLGILGFSSNFYILPSMPEMFETGCDLFNVKEENLVNDMISGFFTAANLSSEIVGPLVGSFLVQFFGMRVSCFIFALYLFLIVVMLITCGGAFRVFVKKSVPSKKRSKQQKSSDIEMELLSN